MYHVTVGGAPFCKHSVGHLYTFSETLEKLKIKATCAHKDFRTAAALAGAIRYFKKLDAKVVEGPCPAYEKESA